MTTKFNNSTPVRPVRIMVATNYKVIDLCRLCLTSADNKLEIFGKVGQQCNISDIISTLFNKVLQNDNWPQSICIACFQKLTGFHEFYSTVKSSQASLVELCGEWTPPDNTQVKEENLCSPADNSTCFKNEEDDRLSLNELHFKNEDLPQNESESDECPEQEKLPDDMGKLSQESQNTNFFNFTCDLCSLKSPTFEELKKHFQEIHNQEGYVKCCNSTIKSRGKLIQHMKKHNKQKMHKCKECGKSFTYLSRYRLHMNSHVPEDEKQFKCEQCPMKFASSTRLKYHQMIHVPREQWEHFCPQCNKSFPTVNVMRSHVKLMHERSQRRTCEICAKSFNFNAEFIDHNLLHHTENPPTVECEDCGMIFKSRRAMLRHTRRKHRVQMGVFNCNDCNKVFDTKLKVQKHRDYAHNKIFKCNLCDKEFKRELNLKEHVATHMGQQSLYKCKFCDKMFNSSSNRFNHQKKKHPTECEEERKNKAMEVSKITPKHL